MVKSRKKFFSNPRGLLLLCLILLLFLITFANITLFVYKDNFAASFGKRPLSLKNIFYLPPNYLIVKDIALYDSVDKKNEILRIPLAVASFSLKEALSNIRLSSIYCPEISCQEDGLLNKEELARFFRFITHLSGQDFFFNAKRVVIKWKQADTFTNLAGSLNFKLKSDKMDISGNLEKNFFSLQGAAREGQLNIENFKFNNENFNSQFWGKISSNLIELKGFILKGKMVGKNFKPDIFILDIDSRARISLPSVDLERLNFSINNNPVRITSQISTEPFNCSLKVLSNFKDMGQRQDVALKKIDLESLISISDKKLRLDAKLNLDISNQNKDSLPLENLKLEIKNLLIEPVKEKSLKFSLEKVDLYSKTTVHSYEVALNGIYGNISPGEISRIKLAAKIYDGLLSGRANIKFQGFNPIISAELRAKDISANNLKGIEPDFEKIFGLLSARVFFYNYPELAFKGNLKVKNGHLDNFEFFKWLADLFRIDSLKKIKFDSLKGDFLANKEGLGLSYLNMDSQKLKLSGYFRLREQDMVSSKIFFTMRKEYLEKSPKFRPLLRILDPRHDWIKFNFQLSGKLNNMNFSWLESDFKEDLRKAIPNFAKKGFEEKISKIIESISKN